MKMFHVISKHTINGYVPVAVASSVKEGEEMIGSMEGGVARFLAVERCPETENLVHKFQIRVGSNTFEYYSITGLEDR
jgi:hypothetical protein